MESVEWGMDCGFGCYIRMAGSGVILSPEFKPDDLLEL